MAEHLKAGHLFNSGFDARSGSYTGFDPVRFDRD